MELSRSTHERLFSLFDKLRFLKQDTSILNTKRFFFYQKLKCYMIHKNTRYVENGNLGEALLKCFPQSTDCPPIVQ